MPETKIPMVVETPVPDIYEKNPYKDVFALYDENMGNFQYYYLKTKTEIHKAEKIPIKITTEPITKNSYDLIDGNTKTFGEFLVSEEGKGRAKIIIMSERPIKSDSFYFNLNPNVALPDTIEIKVFLNNKEKIVLSKKQLLQNKVDFPEAKGDRWEINFEFHQLLRINELELIQNLPEIVKKTKYIRFLGKSNHRYRLYYNANKRVYIYYKEKPNLSYVKSDDILSLQASVPIKNSEFKMPDSDGDGIIDKEDNCKNIKNPDQKDENNNKIGDACEDFDKDGVLNYKDNCVNDPNSSQRDIDGDGIGDACDKEESRLTEKYPWLPWSGIGFAGLTLIILLFLTINKQKENNDLEDKISSPIDKKEK